MEMKPEEAKCLIDSLFFDNDCISAFLWVRNESLLVKLYPGRIVIPKPVYDELSYPGIAHLKARVDVLLLAGQAQLETISTDTETYEMYYKLTSAPEIGHAIIGKGEAASIALAKCSNGIVASNNLKDVSVYIEEFGLRHITTGDILVEALKNGFITEVQGNTIWASMLAKRRKLGAVTFTDYLQHKL